MPFLETLEIEPVGPASATVIWMHGLGAEANDFYPVPPHLGLPPEFNVRFVFPNATQIPVTVNGGVVMRAWYDILNIGRGAQDETGIRRSAALIDELVDHETERGVPPGHVVLAGFSQGGAMALFTGTRYRAALGGMMCLSAYLPLEETLADEATVAGRGVPIFQAHGTADPVVDLTLGRQSYDLLSDAGYTVDWHEYPMGHSVSPEELGDIGSWLTTVLGR